MSHLLKLDRGDRPRMQYRGGGVAPVFAQIVLLYRRC
jgi:hypothetical protein